MHSDLYWIDAPLPFRLAIMARPRAGDWLEDEIAHWRRSGVEQVVSLLERDEVDELGLAGEAALCARAGIGFRSFPIPDRAVPPDTALALKFAREIAEAGKVTAIHCRAGIGRSSLIAATVMWRAGIAPAEALDAIQEARGVPVPDTGEQLDWILALGDQW